MGSKPRQGAGSGPRRDPDADGGPVADADPNRYWALVESRPRVAGIVPAFGYVFVVVLVWAVLPTAGFALALAGELFAFGALLALRGERERDPYRDFGELPTYESGGLMDGWVISVDPDADEARQAAVVRATRAFLFALLGGCIAATLGVGRLAATGSVPG